MKRPFRRFPCVCRLRLLAGCALWFCSPVRAALSAEERAIADWVAGKQEEMVALLEKAVKIDSPSENVAGVRAVGDLFAAELKQVGLAPQWIPLPAASKRAGHLFAERAGTRGKRLLLIGHRCCGAARSPATAILVAAPA